MANTRFNIVPDQEQLGALNRDLRFFPSTGERLRVLTSQDVEAFNDDGFLTGIRIYDRDEMNDIRDYFDQLVQRVMAEGGDSYSISSAHMRYGRVHDILTETTHCRSGGRSAGR